MTHYYYLIVASRLIDASTRICKVSIGTSRQANRDFLFLLSWAHGHDFYFELVSKQTSDFVLRIQDSLVPNSPEVEIFTARDVVRSIKATSGLPQKAAHKSSSLYQRAMLDSNYRIFKNLRISPCLAENT